MRWNIEAGTFLNKNAVNFVDRFHFLGNENIYANALRYQSVFKWMDHYLYSSTENYASIHLEHHFDGYIMDKIPVLKNLGTKLIVGANHMQMANRLPYSELSLGIEGIYIGPLSLFRLDYAWSFMDGSLRNHGLIVGFTVDL